MDPVIVAAAWRVLVEVAQRVSDGYITSGEAPSELVVRGAGVDIVTVAFGGGDAGSEAELRCGSLPPVPASEWAWPMRSADRRRLVTLVTRGAPRPRSADPRHPRGGVEGQVVVKVLDWLLHTGLDVELVDVRRRPEQAPAWLSQRDHVERLLHRDERRAVWALRVRGAVMAVLHDGWLFTPAGEVVNLHARYVNGASIHEVSELVLGHKMLSEELPPYKGPVIDLPSWAKVALQIDEAAEQAMRARARRTWEIRLRRPKDVTGEPPHST